MIKVLLALWLSVFLFKAYSQIGTFSSTIDVDNLSDIGWSVIPLDDGYLICAAATVQSLDGWVATVLIKTDGNGMVEWKKIYGEQFFAYYPGLSGSFIRTKDEGYAVGGNVVDSVTNDSDALLIKFNNQGDTLWTKTFGGNRFDVFYQCRQTIDNGYILFGQTESFGNVNGDYYLVKTDSLGSFQWKKTYGGFFFEVGRTIELTNDGGFILGGASESYGAGESDGYIIKTDSAGNIQWSKTYGTVKDDRVWDLTTSRDGGYLLWGGLDTIIDVGDAQLAEFVAKLDTTGEIVWRTFFNNPAPHNIWQLRELEDGSIVFIGEKEIPAYDRDGGWIVKLNSNGDLLWERQYSYLQYHGATRRSSFFQGDFHQTPDEGFIVTGGVFNVDSNQTNGISNQDVWLLKLDSNGCLGPDSCGYKMSVGIREVQPSKSLATIVAYPNPFTTQDLISIKANSAEHANENIKFRLFDVSGRLLQSDSYSLNQYGYCEFYVQRGHYPSGIYFYRIISQQGVLGKGKLIAK